MDGRERIARALYEHEWQGQGMPPWPDLPEWLNPGAYRLKADAVLEQVDCTCGVSGPDEFGNRDLIENPDCPVHGEDSTAEGYERDA